MNYSEKDLNDEVEFKILRSSYAIFKKESRLKEICIEEAKAGWQFLEKFDDRRIRLKRNKPVTAESAGLDAYRSNVPTTYKDLTLLVFFVVIGVIFGVFIVRFFH